MLLATCLLAGGSILEAEAQPRRSAEATAPYLDTGPLLDATAVKRLARMLTSPDPEKRNRAFDRVTSLGYHASNIDLTPAVPTLIDIYHNDPKEKYRRAAVAALYAIGDEAGMEQVRQHFAHDPSLSVQYASVCSLLDHYGPRAFDDDTKAAIIARNVIVRKNELDRLMGRQRLIERQRLRMWPRITTGPLEIIETDSLQADSLLSGSVPPDSMQ